MLSVTLGGTGPPMSSSAASIASAAITRYVVYLPPAIEIRPGCGRATACSRDSCDVDSLSPDEQRPQPGVDALDVVVRQRVGQHRVDVLEDVVDVGAARGRVRLVQRPVGVGGADDPVRVPRDDEQHRLLGAQDQAGLGVDPVAWDHDVDALGRPHVETPATAGEGLDVVGPDTGRVDDHRRADVDLLVGLDVAHPGTDDPLAGVGAAPTTSAELRTVAPYVAAVRATVRVWRASSACAS